MRLSSSAAARTASILREILVADERGVAAQLRLAEEADAARLRRELHAATSRAVRAPRRAPLTERDCAADSPARPRAPPLVDSSPSPQVSAEAAVAASHPLPRSPATVRENHAGSAPPSVIT